MTASEPSLRPPNLIIFDCDGVLIDSEVIGSRAVAEFLTKTGFSISPEEVARRYTGISSDSMLRDIEKELGRALPKSYPDELQQRVLAAFDAELVATEGVREVLEALTQKVCVASSSSQDRLRHSLEKVGLLHYFEPNLFSSSQVLRGKPAPDLFLFAASCMGFAPDKCLVIEDSAPGVEGACAAHMTVYGFTGGSHFREHPNSSQTLLTAGATAIFERMKDLIPLLSEK